MLGKVARNTGMLFLKVFLPLFLVMLAFEMLFRVINLAPLTALFLGVTLFNFFTNAFIGSLLLGVTISAFYLLVQGGIALFRLGFKYLTS